MGKELTVMEPLAAPAMERPGVIPLWPVWLVSLLGACERTTSGMLEIPEDRTLNASQRTLISGYIESLEALRIKADRRTGHRNRRLNQSLHRGLRLLRQRGDRLGKRDDVVAILV